MSTSRLSFPDRPFHDPGYDGVHGHHHQACRPRMMDLVEAGVGGALGEGNFAKCLQVRHTSLHALLLALLSVRECWRLRTKC